MWGECDSKEADHGDGLDVSSAPVLPEMQPPRTDDERCAGQSAANDEVFWGPQRDRKVKTAVGRRRWTARPSVHQVYMHTESAQYIGPELLCGQS